MGIYDERFYGLPHRAGRITGEDGEVYNELDLETITKPSGKVTVMNAVSVTTGSDSEAIPIAASGYDAVAILVTADFPVSPTDDLNVNFYASLDGITWSTQNVQSVTLDSGTDPSREMVLIDEPYPYVKATAARSGSTDTITVTIEYVGIRYKKTGVAV